MDESTPLGSAIKQFGSQAELARYLDISPSMVNQWVKGVRPIPAEQIVAIERGTGGNVAVEAFGDTTTWVRVRDASWPHPSGRPLVDVARAAQADGAPSIPERTEG